MSRPEKKPSASMSPDEVARTATAMRAELLRQYRTHPMVQTASAAATEINDILNAVALRLALLRWQQAGTRNDASIARLGSLVEHAAMRLRHLQDYARAVEKARFALQPIELTEAAVVGDASTGRLRTPGRTKSLNTATRVLMVSTNDNREFMTRQLKRCGCAVTVAESPEEALGLLDSGQHFDHVVCDAAILEETGLKFAAEVAESSPNARVFLLAFKADIDQQLDRVP